MILTEEKNRAVERILDCYEREMYLYARKLAGGNEYLVDDIISISLQKIIKSIHWITSLPPGEGKEKAYVYAIVKHVYIDMLRREKRLKEFPYYEERDERSVEDEYFSEPPAEHLKLEDMSGEIWDQLKDDEKEILLLKYDQRLSDYDIAVYFGISPAGVRQRISRTKRRLAEILGIHLRREEK